MRRNPFQLVTDASLVHENENETDLTVEIEVYTTYYVGSFTYFLKKFYLDHL